MNEPEILDWAVTLLMPDGSQRVITRPRFAHSPPSIRWASFRLDPEHVLAVGVERSHQRDTSAYEEPTPEQRASGNFGALG